MGNLIHFETVAGEPIQLENAKLIPFTQEMHVLIPGLWGGVLWERPVSILVKRDDGEEEIIPVQDPTLYIIWALLGAVALTWLFTRIKRH